MLPVTDPQPDWVDCPLCGELAVGPTGRCSACLDVAIGGLGGRADRSAWFQLEPELPAMLDLTMCIGLAILAAMLAVTEARDARGYAACLTLAPLIWLARADLWRLGLLTLASCIVIPLTACLVLTVWMLGLFFVVIPILTMLSDQGDLLLIFNRVCPLVLLLAVSVCLVRATRPRLRPRPFWLAVGDAIAFVALHLLGALLAFRFSELSRALLELG